MRGLKHLLAFLVVAVIGLSMVGDAHARRCRSGCGSSGCGTSSGCGVSSGCNVGSSGCNISSNGSSGCNISRAVTPDTAVPVQATPFQFPALKSDAVSKTEPAAAEPEKAKPVERAPLGRSALSAFFSEPSGIRDYEREFTGQGVSLVQR